MGNGIAEKALLCSVPDTILLKIFQFLDYCDLVRVSGVSIQWYRVARDEHMWKRLMLLDYELPLTTKLRRSVNEDEEISWYDEYCSLAYKTPIRLCQTIDAHTDEVLHVSFSPDGSLMASCSKDCYVKIWFCSDRNANVALIAERNMKVQLRWRYSQYSQFNEDSTLLLVSGVQNPTSSTAGEIAVFEIDRESQALRFRCRVLNRPYDVFGCWFDAGHILSGEHFYLGHQFLIGASASHLWLCKASQDTHTERTAVLAPLCKFLNRNGANLRMILCSRYVSEHVRAAVLLMQITQRSLSKSGKKMDVTEEHFESEFLESMTFMESGESRKCSNCERKHDMDEAMATDICTCICHRNGGDRLLIFSTGSETYTPHQVGFKLVSRTEVLERLEADLMPDSRRVQVMDKMREFREAQQKKAEKDEQEESTNVFDDEEGEAVDVDENDNDDNMSWEDLVQLFDRPDHIVDMRGHVIGMALSQDQRYLFVNVRPWPEGAQVTEVWDPPAISQQIEVRVIDLETLTVLSNEVYKSHQGFTPNEECFFIFLDASQKFVCSGSEDSHGYLWSRDYGCLLAKFEHNNVVNSAAINPKNPEMLVTASDDRTLKVWRSRRTLKEMK